MNSPTKISVNSVRTFRKNLLRCNAPAYVVQGLMLCIRLIQAGKPELACALADKTCGIDLRHVQRMHIETAEKRDAIRNGLEPIESVRSVLGSQLDTMQKFGGSVSWIAKLESPLRFPRKSYRTTTTLDGERMAELIKDPRPEITARDSQGRRMTPASLNGKQTITTYVPRITSRFDPEVIAAKRRA